MRFSTTIVIAEPANKIVWPCFSQKTNLGNRQWKISKGKII